MQVQVLLQLAPQKPSGQGRWQRVPVGERNRVSLACPTPSIRVLLDTFLGVYWYTPNSTTGLRPAHPRMLTCPASLALALSMNRVAAFRVVTVTVIGTAFTKLPLLGEGAVGRAD